MQDLIQENDLENAIVFVMGTICHLLDIPILVVMPKVKDDNSIAGGHSLVFECCHLYVDDQHLKLNDFPIKLISNRWDYMASFIEQNIGEILNVGNPAVEKVKDAASPIQKLSAQLPDCTKIKGGIALMQTHLDAAAKVAASLDFKTGAANITCIESVKVPRPEAFLIEPVQRQVRTSMVPSSSTVPSTSSTVASTTSTATAASTTVTTTAASTTVTKQQPAPQQQQWPAQYHLQQDKCNL